MSVRIRMHLSAEHGPNSATEAARALYSDYPVWVLDLDGRIVAANRLASTIWSLGESGSIGADVFEIFAGNVEKIRPDENEMFWSAKFRIEAALGPSYVHPAFERIRGIYPELEEIRERSLASSTPQAVWQYVMIMRPSRPRPRPQSDSSTVHPRPPGRLEFRTTVSAIIDEAGEPRGFVAEYRPLPRAAETASFMNELYERAKISGRSYVMAANVQGTRPIDEDDLYDALPTPRQASKEKPETLPVLTREPQLNEVVAPASRLQISVVLSLGVAGLLLALITAAVGINSGLSILAASIMILFGAVGVVALLAVLRSASFRSEYLAAAQSMQFDLGRLVVAFEGRDSLDIATVTLLEELIDSARNMRDGLVLSRDTQLASGINEAAYRALELSERAGGDAEYADFGSASRQSIEPQ